jgi:hypothetical protein
MMMPDLAEMKKHSYKTLIEDNHRSIVQNNIAVSFSKDATWIVLLKNVGEIIQNNP